MGRLGFLPLAEDLLHLEHAEEDHVHGVSQVDVPVVATPARVDLVRHHFLRSSTGGSGGGGGG